MEQNPVWETDRNFYNKRKQILIYNNNSTAGLPGPNLMNLMNFNYVFELPTAVSN